MDGILGSPAGLKTLSPAPLVDLVEVFKENNKYILAYAAVYVKSNIDKKILIKLGSDDGYKLWFNHELIAANHVHRPTVMDQNIHEVLLKKGLNPILLKIDQDIGAFSFILRLTETSGIPLEGVEYFLSPLP